jgi:hypothetical protein
MLLLQPHALGILYLPMKSSTESCLSEQLSASRFQEEVSEFETHPILTLMRNPPPINRNPLPTLLRPRPLNRQIRITHQRLPNIIKTVIDVILLGLQHVFVSLVDGAVVHSRFQREEEGPHVVEAVQLVEDGDVVDFAFDVVGFGGWLAGG